MREHRYNQAAQHKADHECLLDELRDIMDHLRDGEGHSVERLKAGINGADCSICPLTGWAAGPFFGDYIPCKPTRSVAANN